MQDAIPIKFYDLFAGIGGFRLGLEQASKKFTCAGSCEANTHAATVYRKRFGELPYPDARNLDGGNTPDFDLLCAGFPCQAFSVAGKRLGFEDTRGTIFFEIARLARLKRPRYMLLENVAGLLSHDRGRTFATILATLDELGYDAEWQVLNSKYWVPQNRERVFIIGYLRGEPRPEVFPLGADDESGLSPPVTAGSKGYAMGLIQVGNVDKKGHNSIWGRVYDPAGIAPNLNSEGGGLGAKTGLFVMLSHTKANMKKRIQDRDTSWTLDATGSKQGILNNAKIRRLTPLECERLQGFPDNWTEGLSDTQRYRCIGNAVTVPVIRTIGERLAQVI